MRYKLKDMCMCGNEHGKLAKDIIYTKLVDENDLICVSATLDYVLKVIRERKLEVEGVTVSTYERDGVMCSIVSLDFYGGKQ